MICWILFSVQQTLQFKYNNISVEKQYQVEVIKNILDYSFLPLIIIVTETEVSHCLIPSR